MTAILLEVRVYEKGKRQKQHEHEVYSVTVTLKPDEDAMYRITSVSTQPVVVVKSDTRRMIGLYRDRHWRRMDMYETAAATVLFCITDAKRLKKRAAAYKGNEQVAKVVHNSKTDHGLVSCRHEEEGGPVGYKQGAQTELDKLFYKHFGKDADYGGFESANAKNTLKKGGEIESKEKDFVQDTQGIEHRWLSTNRIEDFIDLLTHTDGTPNKYGHFIDNTLMHAKENDTKTFQERTDGIVKRITGDKLKQQQNATDRVVLLLPINWRGMHFSFARLVYDTTGTNTGRLYLTHYDSLRGDNTDPTKEKYDPQNVLRCFRASAEKKDIVYIPEVGTMQDQGDGSSCGVFVCLGILSCVYTTNQKEDPVFEDRVFSKQDLWKVRCLIAKSMMARKSEYNNAGTTTPDESNEMIIDDTKKK
jgi:hypothetical protein